jgi:hypothetical protein
LRSGCRRNERQQNQQRSGRRHGKHFGVKGIEVSADLDLSYAGLDVLSVERDLKAEKASVSAILGKVDVDNLGANIMYYQGEYGQAEFRGSGSFDILMDEGAVPTGSDAEATARDFLKKLGISAMKGETAQKSILRTVRAQSSYAVAAGGHEIINCTVTFSFSGKLDRGDRNGRWTMSAPTFPKRSWIFRPF